MERARRTEPVPERRCDDPIGAVLTRGLALCDADGRGQNQIVDTRLDPAEDDELWIWAERFIKTLLVEWAYAKLYRSNTERLTALPRWAHFYNHGRPHTSLVLSRGH